MRHSGAEIVANAEMANGARSAGGYILTEVEQLGFDFAVI
jgi:hypothetical protein